MKAKEPEVLGECEADDMVLRATLLGDCVYVAQRWLNMVGEPTGVSVALTAEGIRWLRPLLDQALPQLEASR